MLLLQHRGVANATMKKTAVPAGGIFFTLAVLLTQRVEDLYDLRRTSGSLRADAAAAKS